MPDRLKNEAEDRAIIDELSGEAASMKLAESFDGADERSLALMQETTGKNYELIPLFFNNDPFSLDSVNQL